MKKKSVIRLMLNKMLVASILLCSSFQSYEGWSNSIFDEMNHMTIERYQTLPEIEKDIYLKYKNLYEKNISLSKLSNEYLIPKIIHFIWLGPNNIPIHSIRKINSWCNLHPDWKIIFWTDDPNRVLPSSKMEKRLIETIDIGELKDIYSECNNWGQKSDILRYFILKELGGIYVDHDIICIKPFDLLANKYNLFCCLERIHEDSAHHHFVFPSNCLIGCTPEHPVLINTIKNVSKTYNEQKKSNKIIMNKYEKVITTTFASFFLATRTHADLGINRDIILPGMYFFHTCISNNLQELKNIMDSSEFIYCLHSFDGTW